MIKYLFETTFEPQKFSVSELNHTDYEQCLFKNCDFRNCIFVAVTFIDCRFENCNFDETKINYVAFRTVHFEHCSFRNVNFAMTDKLIFEMHFNYCILDFSKFYTLKLKSNSFSNSSLVAVDFMAADVSSVVFETCDLYRAEFDKAIANKTNFKTSYNYTINPARTKLKKAIFSLEGAKGLLQHYGIEIIS